MPIAVPSDRTCETRSYTPPQEDWRAKFLSEHHNMPARVLWRLYQRGYDIQALAVMMQITPQRAHRLRRIYLKRNG